MKRTIAVIAVLTLTGAAGALAYQAVARDRAYRALLTRGDTALADEQTFGAIEAYSGAIALHPDSMLAHLRRGETYQRRGDRGDLDQAARDFRAGARLDPTATRPLEELADVLYQLQRYPQAAETYLRYLRLDDRSARVSYKLALTYYASGDLDAALSALAQVHRITDRMADSYYLLGLCLRDARRDREAIQAFETAVSRSPGSIAAREELADLYASIGRRSDELEQLQVIAGLDGSHVERQVAVGMAQARAGHGELAVQTLGSALERTPDQPPIYGALGQVWLDIAQTRNDRVALSKALEALGRAASSPGATSELLTVYGRALLQDGQNDLAEHVLRQASSRYPLDPAALLWYATAAERENHFDTARDALIDYGGLAEDDGDAVSRAARIAALSLRLDDAPTAVEWLHRALAATPNDVHLLVSLADAELRAGNREGARVAIARGLNQDAKNPALLSMARRAR
jgi:tetratricopeptide (TPR) repeat protein